jgi:hypothetical protein
MLPKIAFVLQINLINIYKYFIYFFEFLETLINLVFMVKMNVCILPLPLSKDIENIVRKSEDKLGCFPKDLNVSRNDLILVFKCLDR